MAFLSKVHLSCFLLSYLIAFGVEVLQLLRGRSTVARTIQIVSMAAGLVAHTAYLVARSAQSGLPPLVGSSHDWLLVLAWLGAVFLLVALLMQERIALGLFLLPAVLGLVIMATLVDSTALPAHTRQLAVYRWGMLHAATLVIGMGFAAAAMICALMYLLQYRKLRGRGGRLSSIKLPSLEVLTGATRWSVVGTVVMLTTGLVTGVILAFSQRDESFRWSEPIVIGTLIVWSLMVLTLVWQLRSHEQTGRQVARLTLLTGGFLLLTVFGLMLLTGGVHGRRQGKEAEETSRMSATASADSALQVGRHDVAGVIFERGFLRRNQHRLH